MRTFPGIPTDFYITAANEDDRDTLEEMLEYYRGIHILGGSGYLRDWWQKELREKKNIHLWTPKRSHQKVSESFFYHQIAQKNSWHY